MHVVVLCTKNSIFAANKNTKTMDKFVSEFTEEELAATKEADDLLFDNIEWEKIPLIVKKRIWTRRKINIEKYKGSIKLVDGFSFDSDSKVRLYNW